MPAALPSGAAPPLPSALVCAAAPARSRRRTRSVAPLHPLGRPAAPALRGRSPLCAPGTEEKTGPVRDATARSWNQTGPEGAAGVAGAAGAAGAKGNPGTPATKLFAQVKSNGTLNEGSPNVVTTRASTGTCFVRFPQDISHCAAFANQGAIPIFTTPGANTGSVTGHAHAVLTSAGASYPGGYPSGQTVVVVTQNASNADTDADFTVAVVC